MAYWVIDKEAPGYVFQCLTETPATAILESQLNNMRRRLTVLSKGLLEARDNLSDHDVVELYLYGFHVNFLHRTVKDYLQTPEAQAML